MLRTETAQYAKRQSAFVKLNWKNINLLNLNHISAYMPYTLFFNSGNRTSLMIWKELLRIFKRYENSIVNARGEQDLYLKLSNYCKLKKVKYFDATSGSFDINPKIKSDGLKPTFSRIPEYYMEGKLNKIPISRLIEQDTLSENKYSVKIKNKRYPALEWHHAPSLTICKKDYFFLAEIYRSIKRCNKHMNLFISAKDKLFIFTPEFSKYLGNYPDSFSFKKIDLHEIDSLKGSFF